MRKIYPPAACGWHLRSPYGKKEADRPQLDDAAEICRLLVQNGIAVSAIIPTEQNLEEYFMTMTGGKTA